ncbi:DSBA-like thioredoxin domain-containing protein [Paracoccus alcaliphilus]|uniref:DSBA-like thioredoxin domain-containing protein n=1 Tax=Paracoccus alcaliphilus TaxID=34002 RepID=A0A1H8MWX5_9RHOB|nr:DsbA family protein [Paracoccus alcaliphilus]WCR19610.1 DsbA family protein [Paracoccus alcaliphilus]SEO21885.1 DSBA-like thioredoxin domain-containing protein [Paracoccus alcaliphilus]
MAQSNRPDPARRRFLRTGIAASILAAGGISARAQDNPMPPDLRQALEQEQLGAVLGNPSGDVTLTEFFDYNCPYCRASVPDIRQLIWEDPRLRVVLREWPVLGAASLYCARASLASLRQQKFWQFHAGLMGIEGQADDKSALAVAEVVGLDRNRLRADMEGIVIARQIEHSWILAEKMGLAGTPTFIAGDFGAFGKQSLDELRSMIAAVRRSRS